MKLYKDSIMKLKLVKIYKENVAETSLLILAVDVERERERTLVYGQSYLVCLGASAAT